MHSIMFCDARKTQKNLSPENIVSKKIAIGYSSMQCKRKTRVVVRSRKPRLLVYLLSTEMSANLVSFPKSIGAIAPVLTMNLHLFS